MNKVWKKIIVGITLVCTLTMLLPGQLFTVYASAGQIVFSDPSVIVGNEVTVNMKIAAIGGDQLENSVILLAYDENMLEFISGNNTSGGVGILRVTGSASDGNNKTFSANLKFKTLKAGSAQIRVTEQEVYDGNSQLMSIDQIGLSTITIAPLASSSAEASLNSFKISPGILVPDFSPDVENYTLEVGEDADKIAVSVETANAGARVVITGNDALQPGENTLVCKVTAEDGKTIKNYTILVNKGTGLTPVPEYEAEDLTDGIKLTTASKDIKIIPLEKGVTVPGGYQEKEMKVNGEIVTSWVPTGDTGIGFYLFYAVNENGDKGFYRYDEKEKTLQRYYENHTNCVTKDEYIARANEYNSLHDDYIRDLWLLRIATGAAALLFILLLVLLAKSASRKGTAAPKSRCGDNTEEDERAVSKNDERAISREERYMRGEDEEDEEPGLSVEKYEKPGADKLESEPAEDEYEAPEAEESEFEPEEDEYEESETDEFEFEPEEDEYEKSEPDEFEFEPEEDEYEESETDESEFEPEEDEYEESETDEFEFEPEEDEYEESETDEFEFESVDEESEADGSEFDSEEDLYEEVTIDQEEDEFDELELDLSEEIYNIDTQSRSDQNLEEDSIADDAYEMIKMEEQNSMDDENPMEDEDFFEELSLENDNPVRSDEKKISRQGNEDEFEILDL